MNRAIYVWLNLCLVVLTRIFAQQIDTLPELPIGIDIDPSERLEWCFRFVDKAGSHVSILTRSHENADDGSEKIVLQTLQFIKDTTGWLREWRIWDFVECENLDIEGDFVPDLTSFTDLDSNGVLETTIAYKTICSGDVSPKTTKVIMRQGNAKYAVRGESLVKIGSSVTYGGKFEADLKLNGMPLFKDFLIEKWKKAAGY